MRGEAKRGFGAEPDVIGFVAVIVAAVGSVGEGGVTMGCVMESDEKWSGVTFVGVMFPELFVGMPSFAIGVVGTDFTGGVDDASL